MARNIVSFLEQVGSGKISLDRAKRILRRGAPYANKPAPAQGLCLEAVDYSGSNKDLEERSPGL